VNLVPEQISYRSHFWKSVFAIAACSLLLIFLARSLRAQAQQETDAERAYRTAMEDADQKIVAEEHAHSELMKNLEYLTTQIGARLTGSKQMQDASAWTEKRFHDYGIDAHLEHAEVAHAFVRGVDTAEITAPVSKHVEIRSAGWSKATDGAVSGPVVLLESQTPEAIAAAGAKLKGAIVLLGKPATIPTGPADNAYDAVITPQRGVPAARGGFAGGRGGRGGQEALAASGIAVILRDSGKTDSLINMGGAGGGYNPSAVPTAFITHEDYDLLYRLMQSGGNVTMKVSLNGTFSAGTSDAAITVGEIKGSQFPDERVIIGGHLDSWDLGQGALDNGTGAMSTLEAARTLKALGWQPKRTITFILFTGEEEGGIGVQTFLKNHAAEIPKMDAVLVDDTGTGRIFSMALEDLYETAPMMSQIYRPLQEVLDLEPLSTRYFGSSDHVSFLRAGVPAYFCIQEPAHYREAHHSQTDTFDKVIPDQVNEGAALLAAWAWNVSEFPQPLPHHAAAPPPSGAPGR
jgi:carboxypeptidase Q